MSKPPLPFHHQTSPTSSGRSIRSSLDTASESGSEGFESHELERFFGSFEWGQTFSQIGGGQGRGVNIVREMFGLLTHIWLNREESSPELCFDKYDGRLGKIIYHPPRRGPGGIMIPCMLDSQKQQDRWPYTNMSVTNNNISVFGHAGKEENIDEGEPAGRRPPSKKKQQTLRFEMKGAAKPRNRGRFVKKNIVPLSETLPPAPSIPLAPQGLRDILRHWVVGAPERGLSIPLTEFTFEMVNAKDASGKSHKALYSKRKAVSLAVLLALRESTQKGKSFPETIGIKDSQKDLSRITITQWEKIARAYLKGGRKMKNQEIVELGKKLYSDKYIEMLP